MLNISAKWLEAGRPEQLPREQTQVHEEVKRPERQRSEATDRVQVVGRDLRRVSDVAWLLICLYLAAEILLAGISSAMPIDTSDRTPAAQAPAYAVQSAAVAHCVAIAAGALIVGGDVADGAKGGR